MPVTDRLVVLKVGVRIRVIAVLIENRDRHCWLPVRPAQQVLATEEGCRCGLDPAMVATADTPKLLWMAPVLEIAMDWLRLTAI